MAAYLLTLNPEKGGHTLPGAHDAMVVYAKTATMAKQMAAASVDGEGALWTSSDCTATEITSTDDWEGWTFNLNIFDTDGSLTGSFSYVGIEDDTIDEVGTALAALLNVPYTSSYTTSTNVLIIATGGGADDMGDQTVVMEIIPPNGYSSVDALVTITHEGLATANLEALFTGDPDLTGTLVPVVLGRSKQV